MIPRLSKPILLMALVTASGFAQDKNMREHLGTRVTATPETIVLDWDIKHPWNADLNRGASLFAEYDTRSQGVVLQKLAVGRVAGTNVPSMRFVLPAELTVPPTGPVCMFIQLTNNHVLPVRKGGSGHSETARFRDQSWESQAAARSKDSAKRSTLAAFENAARDADRQVELERAQIDHLGIADPARCPSIKAPSFAAERPFDVLSVSQIPDAARRACITRVRRAVDAMMDDVDQAQPDKRVSAMAGNLLSHVMPPGLTVGLLKAVKIPNDEIRMRQLADFQRDWARFSENPDVKPHLILGDESDGISLQTLTSKTSGIKLVELLVYLQVQKPIPSEDLKKIDPDDVAGFVGGELEAYSRCVVDSQHQLQNKLDEWQENQRKAPELQESARKQLISACQESFTRMDTLLKQQKSAHDRLDAARTDNPATSQIAAGPSSSILNDAACSPR